MKSFPLLIFSLFLLVGCYTDPRKDLAQFKVAGVKERETEYKNVATAYVKACKEKDWNTIKYYTSPLTIQNVSEGTLKEILIEQLSPLLNDGTIAWRKWNEVGLDENYNVGLTFSFKCDGRTFYIDVFEEVYQGNEQLYVLNIRDTRKPKF